MTKAILGVDYHRTRLLFAIDHASVGAGLRHKNLQVAARQHRNKWIEQWRLLAVLCEVKPNGGVDEDVEHVVRSIKAIVQLVTRARRR